jgi:hypothetical protein
MAENFISFPTTSLDGDNLPTTLTGAVLSTTTSLSGLTNGTAYRTFVLANPSDAFTPTAAAVLTASYLTESNATPSKSAAVLTYATVDYATAGITAGDRLVIGTHHQSTNRVAVSGAFGANAMTLKRAQAVASNMNLNHWTVTAPSGTSAALTVTLDSSAGTIDAGAFWIYKLSGAPSADVSGGVSGSGTTSQTFDIAVTENGVLIAATADVRVTDAHTATGFNNQRPLTLAGNAEAQIRHGFTNVTADATQTITATLSGNGALTAIATSFEA